MDSCVPKINVHQVRISPDQDTADRLQFTAIDQARLAGDIFQIRSSNRVYPPFLQQLNISKRITIAIFAVFGNHERFDPCQLRDLAVNVLHLGLQEERAVAGNERLHEAPATGVRNFSKAFLNSPTPAPLAAAIGTITLSA